jgi:hypothetical protein
VISTRASRGKQAVSQSVVVYIFSDAEFQQAVGSRVDVDTSVSVRDIIKSCIILSIRPHVDIEIPIETAAHPGRSGPPVEPSPR